MMMMTVTLMMAVMMTKMLTERVTVMMTVIFFSELLNICGQTD